MSVASNQTSNPCIVGPINKKIYILTIRLNVINFLAITVSYQKSFNNTAHIQGQILKYI